MKFVALSVYRSGRSLTGYELSEFGILARSTIRNTIDFLISETVRVATNNNDENKIETKTIKILASDKLENCRLVVYALNRGTIVCIIGSSDILSNKIHNTLMNIINHIIYNVHTNDSMDKYIIELNKNFKVDKIDDIMMKTDDVKLIMIENIEKVLWRGEQLDILIDKTDQLSKSSKVFLKNAKKLNSCCTLL